MNNFLPVKSNYRAASLRLAARLFSIMILAFLWPARGGAVEQSLPADWPAYGQTANIVDGTDIAVSDTNYTVKTARGLAWIAWVTNEGKTKEGNTSETYSAYYPAANGFAGCKVTLANNISLVKPEDGAVNFESNWIPIGVVSASGINSVYTKCFQGTFDGGGNTITGMKISSATVDNTGLFGYLYGATVKDLTMAESTDINWTSITSTNTFFSLGSIVGCVENGKIINCHNQCTIRYSSEMKGYVGGIAGSTKGSVISACSNSGDININGYGGGIVGVNGKSSIVSSFNTGNINVTGSAEAYAGGIIGGDFGYSAGSNISHCYSTGSMTAKSTQSLCASGGIAGMACLVIESCFATGAVSAESSSSGHAAYAGGIIGWVWNHNNSSLTVKDCLALNTDGVKAIGNASDKYAGRIVGKDNNATLSNNYASTKIKLTVGEDTSAPTTNIAADAINGADLYFDEAAAVTASWAGDGKAFTAIGTDAAGTLPQLKAVISFDDNGLPETYGEAISGQPAASMESVSYLVMPDPLSLPASDTETITLSCSNGKWSYKQGSDETLTRFNGTVKMAEGVATSTNKLVIATVTDNPTLTFDQLKINPSNGAALTIESGCELTINTTGEGTSILSSSDASTLVNKGSLTLTGKGFYIGNTSSTDTHYGLDNSGIFTVTEPAVTSVTFHCVGTAIHNTGTLGNAWMEWQFVKAWENHEDIAFAAIDDANQSPSSLSHNGKTFATTVTAGKTYRLWKVTNAAGEVRTSQKGKNSKGALVSRFSAPSNNEVAVYTEVQNLETINVFGEQSFSVTGCADQNVTVTSGGTLTVDVDDAFVFNLRLEENAQLITTKPLKVSETFNMSTRTLENKWITFGSPVALTASVGNESNLLCAATGYTSTDAKSQGWDNLSGITKEGTETADLAADTPYLLAAETGSTEVTFTATAPADQPIEIPSTATVTLGDALANGTFLFQTNPNLANLMLSNIYVLNVEGNRFELKAADYVVKPFEAFIVANAVTRARVASLRVGGDIATGIEQPLADGTTRIWGTRGALHISADAPADVRVVTPTGQILRTLKVSAGDTTLALPAGIYFVRCNGITYKVSL